MIRHYGSWLGNRIERVASVLGMGCSALKSLVYVPLENYGRHCSQPITDCITAIARTLTYHQREYDYAWDNDLAGLTVRENTIVSTGGQIYQDLLISMATIGSPKIFAVFEKLRRKGARIVLIADKPEGDTIRAARSSCSLEDIATLRCFVDELPECLTPSICPVTFSPGGVPISARSRRLDEQTWAIFLLNESKESQTITPQCEHGWRLEEEDLVESETCRKPCAVTSFRPGESKLLFAVHSLDGRHLGAVVPVVRRELPLTDWQLELPEGKSFRLSKGLLSWTDLGFGNYSGFMSYTTRFQWDGSDACLDLGEVRYAAAIWIDGRKRGDAVFTPFRVNLPGLSKGWHTLRVDVLNTLANSICGTKEREHELQEKGVFIGTYAPIYLPIDRRKVPSGLLGPVFLRAFRDL